MTMLEQELCRFLLDNDKAVVVGVYGMEEGAVAGKEGLGPQVGGTRH